MTSTGILELVFTNNLGGHGRSWPAAYYACAPCQAPGCAAGLAGALGHRLVA